MKPSLTDLILDIMVVMGSGAVVAKSCWLYFQLKETGSVVTVGSFFAFLWFACACRRIVNRIFSW
jgi:hypothetical protein